MDTDKKKINKDLILDIVKAKTFDALGKFLDAKTHSLKLQPEIDLITLLINTFTRDMLLDPFGKNSATSIKREAIKELTSQSFTETSVKAKHQY